MGKSHVAYRQRVVILLACLIVARSGDAARAWDEDGHAIITHLAVDALPASMPDWLRSPEVRSRLVYLSSEPDRWRGQQNVHLDHINGPDHYFDCEELAQYGLTLERLPLLRTEFTDWMAARRAAEPERFPRRNPERDKDYTAQSPGLLPYAIAELQWKLAASWTQLKTYEAHRDKVSDEMIAHAREAVVFHMGLISHFVGDGAQPLHLTKHHHGWVGDNPNGYTTDRGFHAHIDGGVISLHAINYDDLKIRVLPARRISTQEYWQDISRYLEETFARVEPLYRLEKSGGLSKADGKCFIEERLLAGGSALAGVWAAAFEGAKLDEFRVNRLKERPARYQPGRRKQSRQEALAPAGR